MDKANLVGESLCQGKNDLQSGSIFYGLVLAPKTKYVFNRKQIWCYTGKQNFQGV